MEQELVVQHEPQEPGAPAASPVVRPWARTLAVFAFAGLVGIAGAWLGMVLLSPTTVGMGPFRVEVSGGFGRGETELGLPPFGALTADTHLAPLHLSARLQDVGVERLTELVNRVGIDGLVSAVEADARSELASLAWRLLAVGALGAAALGLLVFRSRWRLVTTAFVTAVLVVAGSEVLALATFRTSAFSEPRYSGTLALAPQFIGPVREATGRIDDLRAGLEQIVNGTVRAYTSLQTAPVSGDGVIRVLHISDIHASPLGMDFAQDVARGFDVDMVIDTGDLTSFATPVEDLIVSRIGEFDVPYVFVRGNHDSMTLQAEVRRAPNSVVLDGRAAAVDGLMIYGLGHPAFTPARGVAVDDAAFAELARRAGDRIAEDLDSSPAVDLVAVHDDRMAEAVAGRVPVVISGHFHETSARVRDGTLFLRIATTGGSGAGVFRGLDVPLTAEVLYFSHGPVPRLLAYDVVEQQPDSGNLTVQRVVVAEAFGELVPSPSPEVTGPTGASAGTGFPVPTGPAVTDTPSPTSP
jgi:predicted phosphodiesterase